MFIDIQSNKNTCTKIYNYTQTSIIQRIVKVLLNWQKSDHNHNIQDQGKSNKKENSTY